MYALMRYTVKADQLQTHLELLRDVYDDLATRQPAGIAWTTYQVADTPTFVEFVEGPDLPQPLPQIESFQRYRAGLDDRCEPDREFEELQRVGSFSPSTVTVNRSPGHQPNSALPAVTTAVTP